VAGHSLAQTLVIMHLMRRERFALPTRLVCGALTFGACAALASCAVGPAYHQPEPPQVQSYTAAPVVTTIPPAASAPGAVAGGQALHYGAAVDAQWWRNFGSPTLDRLVGQALAHNPDLAAAQATLEQAQNNLKAAKGVFYPHVAFGVGGERTRTSGAATGGSFGPQLYNLYTGQVSVSYSPDVFGLNRLVTRGEQAQVDVAADQLTAARLTIAGNVVNTVFDLAALDDEVAATRDSLDAQRQILELTRTRYQLGATSRFDVLTQESQVASSEARLPQLQQARDAARHLLATWLGEFPAEAGDLATPALAELRLPAALPVSLPSALVRQRPDILAAEAQLRAANAQVGEAVARMYPNLQLTGSFGAQSNGTGALFDPASRLWNVAAGLVAPLFAGGTLMAQKHATQAAYRAVFADYQSTVLGAFRNVADVLRALQHDATLLDAQARAMHDAQQALQLVQTQYQTGAVDYVSLLTSQTQYQNARIALVQAQAQRYADTAALYLAMGGGDWVDAPAPVGNDEADTR
jgi:NodT family efflux transporter outer membrane factor (OMF) lipoprotein